MSEETQAIDKPNRMERRRLATRAKLLAAALQLVLEKGVEKTTMDGITDSADLGRRTLYYHFTSKEECILAAVAGEYQKHASRAELSLSSSPDPAMVVATHGRAVFAGLVGEPVTNQLVEYPKLLAAALEQAVAGFALEDFRKGLEQGRFTLSMSERLLDRVLVWSLAGFLIEHFERGTKVDELQSAYAILVLTNLGIEAGEARALNEQAKAELA